MMRVLTACAHTMPSAAREGPVFFLLYLAEISGKSTQKLFILIEKNKIYGMKVSQKHLTIFLNEHCWQPARVPKLDNIYVLDTLIQQMYFLDV